MLNCSVDNLYHKEKIVTENINLLLSNNIEHSSHTFRMKYLILIFAMIHLTICNCFTVNCQTKEADSKKIELKKYPFTRIIYVGKLVKIDYHLTDTLVQINGRITEIRDSAIVVNGRNISIKSINAIYVKHLVLGTTLLIIGTSLLVCEVLLISHISVLAAAGNPNYNPFILIPFATGMPLTIAGLISVLQWRKFNLSKGWVISIKNTTSQNALESYPP